jgi:hypothetical protein
VEYCVLFDNPWNYRSLLHDESTWNCGFRYIYTSIFEAQVRERQRVWGFESI